MQILLLSWEKACFAEFDIQLSLAPALLCTIQTRNGINDSVQILISSYGIIFPGLVFIKYLFDTIKLIPVFEQRYI